MAKLIRLNIDLYIFSLRNSVGLILLVGCVLNNPRTLAAAPLTFRFDAEIVDVLAGSPFDLPLSYQVGDTIRGKFTFQPGAGVPINDVAVGADQLSALEFNINNTRVPTTTFRIVAFNNSVDYDAEGT